MNSFNKSAIKSAFDRTPSDNSAILTHLDGSLGQALDLKHWKKLKMLRFGIGQAAKFRSRCSKINPVIKSAASAASPITNMQESSSHLDHGLKVQLPNLPNPLGLGIPILVTLVATKDFKK